MTSAIMAGIRPRLRLPAEQTVVMTLMSSPLIGRLVMVKADGGKKKKKKRISLVMAARMRLDIPL